MAQLLVLVTSNPFESANALSALRYCETALDMGHEVIMFFYSSGALIANAYTQPPTDEHNLYLEFANLAKDNDTARLIVCNTAANRRGLIAEEESHALGHNITSPFSTGGLAEFVQYTQSCDRMVQF